MKTNIATLLILALNTCGWLAHGQADQEKADAAAPAAVDLAAGTRPADGSEAITTDDAPLTDVILLLGRQANLNIQISPKVTGGVGPDGKPAPVPQIKSMSWRGVTAQQALEAILANHSMELQIDPKTKIATVVQKDPNAPEPMHTKVIQLHHANPTNLVPLVKATLSARSQVLADARTSQLVVLSTLKELEAINELISKLDSPTKQVLIEARLIETARNPSSVKGVDWSGTLSGQKVTFGNGVTSSETVTTTPGVSGTTTLPSGRTVGGDGGSSSATVSKTVQDPLAGIIGLTANTAKGWNPETAFLNADGASVVLSFLNTDADSEVVATPRAVTLDNEEARLEVTRSFPIFQQSPGSAQVAATTQIIYTNVGTILKVTPRISANKTIAMAVTPEVSNIDSKDRQVVNGSVNEANVYATRKITTRVVIPSGNTLVMGGLVSDSINKGYTKVPIFGDIPGLGWAFRHESKKRSKSNLLIFITPTIVQDGDFTEADSQFLKTRPPGDKPDQEESAWDSAKPHDWSKPVY